MQGLLEARAELRPLLLKSHDRLKDLLFLDIALDSMVRTAIERVYEELNNAGPEVHPVNAMYTCVPCVVSFPFYPFYFSLTGIPVVFSFRWLNTIF